MKPIDEMTNAEMDEAVAVEVMGWDKEQVQEALMLDWAPSRRIAAAWQVVSALAERGWYISLEGPDDGKWICTIRDPNCGKWDREGTYSKLLGEAWNAPSAALAICRAALKAVREVA